MQRIAILFLILCVFTSHAQTVVSDWLVVKNLDVKYPAFHDTENLKGDVFDETQLLKFDYFDAVKLHPAVDDYFYWNTKKSQWTKSSVNRKKQTEISDIKAATINLAVSYLSVDRWMKGKLQIEINRPFMLLVDGKSEGTKSYTKEKDKLENHSFDLTLEKGTHTICLKILQSKDKSSTVKFTAKFEPSDDFKAAQIKTSLRPEFSMTIHNVLEGKKLSRQSISANGEYVAVSFSETEAGNGKTNRWYEVYNIASKNLEQNYKGASIRSFNWAPKSNSYVYQSNGDVWLHDLREKKNTLLFSKKDVSSLYWSPDESFLIYTISENPENGDSDIKRHLGPEDRQSWFRNRSFIYKYDIQSQTHQRLTFGNYSTSLHDISPDSKSIVFSTRTVDYKERPYSKQNLYKLNLENNSIEPLWENKLWGGYCQFSPKGNKLIVTGGPLVFGKIGENIKEGQISNNYDRQAYIFDLNTKKAEAITKNFNPAISSVYWANENTIYLLCEDESFQHLYKYDIGSKKFEKINLPHDVISQINFAKNSQKAVFCASSVSKPYAGYVLDLNTNKSEEFANPDKENYELVSFGKTKDWDFKSKEGKTIKGRVYFPPDFDENKKYPVIVNYYGGTVPVRRSFGGRYPLNLYASMGYIVYLLQPSGATGFGQEFSACHVNNWGKTVADEIITGTKKFLDAHSFADADNVGCIGASYGGFLTMFLQTQTDIFSAAISHAGISALSSYWGEGFWGYTYSAIATANQFPWNNKDLYTNQSPLFNADKVKTPVLLLHGDKDTNVPVGESVQFYTALKLLGKEAEFITIKGEDHHIIDYSKRLKWNNIIFSWFDKHLKNQPQRWNELFPEKVERY